MKKLSDYFDNYQSVSLNHFSETELNRFIIEFSIDLGQLIDILSSIINTKKYPNYYSLNDSTVVGLLTRIVKLFQESVYFYEKNKTEIFAQFTRTIYESFIIAKYLMQNGENSQSNFRLISYHSRYENYKKLNELPDRHHPIIQRQLKKLDSKLKLDGFTIDDLHIENKKKNSWKLDGKSFWKIHKEVDNEELYSFVYGSGSDFVHGSWQEIMDFHLTKKGKGYFGYLNYEKCDCRLIVPLNTIIFEIFNSYLLWNDTLTEEISVGFKEMRALNLKVYEIWEKKFGETLQ